MRASRKTDFWKLNITLVSMTYHNQRPQCPSVSPHVLLPPGMLPVEVPLSNHSSLSQGEKIGTHNVHVATAITIIYLLSLL